MTSHPHADALISLLLDYSGLTDLLGDLDWMSFVQGYRHFELLRREEESRFRPHSCCIERLRSLALRFKAA
jgi:hypothetical protein